MDLAAADGKAHPVQRLHAGERLADPLEPEEPVVGHGLPGGGRGRGPTRRRANSRYWQAAGGLALTWTSLAVTQPLGATFRIQSHMLSAVTGTTSISAEGMSA